MARVHLHKCPKCNASETVPLEGSDERKCSYCGAQFTVVSAKASQTASSGPNQRKLVIGSIVGMLVLSAAVVSVSVTRSSKSPKARRARSSSTLSSGSDIQSVTSSTGATLSDAPEEKVEPLSADFQLHTDFDSGVGSRWYYGMITNTSKVALSKPEVIAVLKDEAGKEIDTFHGYAKHDIGPGEDSPVFLIYQEPKPYATIDFELDLRKLGANNIAQGLVVSEHSELREKSGRVKITGKVRNEGATAARFVEVVVMFFDADDELINMTTGYAKADSVPAGGEARFLLDAYERKQAGTTERIEYRVLGSKDTR